MTTFNEFWKEKAQKRRKSWAAKAKRFAEQHTQLEDIRKEVYLPLDYGANFSFDNYTPEHFISNDTSYGKKVPSKPSTRMVACSRLPS